MAGAPSVEQAMVQDWFGWPNESRQASERKPWQYCRPSVILPRVRQTGSAAPRLHPSGAAGQNEGKQIVESSAGNQSRTRPGCLRLRERLTAS
jgi:hypothetical protein